MHRETKETKIKSDKILKNAVVIFSDEFSWLHLIFTDPKSVSRSYFR